MLEAQLTPLSLRQQALLCSLLLFDRKNVGELLSSLPANSRELLGQKAEIFQSAEKEKLLKLVVGHLKDLYRFRYERNAALIEPSWLAARLKVESPQMTMLIMAGFSSFQSKQIKRHLSEDILSKLAKTRVPKPTKHTHFPFMSFLQQFEPMPDRGSSEGRDISHLFELSSNEFLVLLHEFGMVETANVLHVLEFEKSAEYLKRIDTSSQAALIRQIKPIQPTYAVREDFANFVAEKLFVQPFDLVSFWQQIGLFFFGRALLSYSDRLQRQLAQRLPYSHGQKLLNTIVMLRKDGVQAREIGSDQGEKLLMKLVSDLKIRGKISAH